MQVRAMRQDGIWVLRLVGPLVLGAGEHRLRCGVERVLRQGGRRVILDLSGVRYADAAGIGALVGGARRVRSRGGRLLVASATPRVRRLLEMFRVGALLPLAADVEDALRRIAGAPEPHSRMLLPGLRPAVAHP
jgi:anti-sigma B factor antagonist